MKKLRIIFCLFIIFYSGTSIQSQSLEQVLEKYYDAAGLNNLKHVSSIIYQGIYKNHFLKKISDNIPPKLFESDIEIFVNRNKNYLLKISGDPGILLYCYKSGEYWNGHKEGSFMQWKPIANDRLLIQLKLDFEGFLYHSAEKGIQLGEPELVNHKEKSYYIILAITPEKDSLYFYINQKNYLLEKISFEEEIKDNDQQIYIDFSDYKNIAGVQIAFKLTHNIKMLDGSFGKKEEIFSNVEFNTVLDHSIFDCTKY